jgi:ribosomal protein S18 acetylase RimI-like enzyme
MTKVVVEKLTAFKRTDLQDLCDATVSAISDGIGFNWVLPPTMDTLETYWNGVLLVPERILFVGRLDGSIAGGIQLLKPPPSRETSSFAASFEGHFVAPWARGHGIAKALLMEAEREARKLGFSVLRLSVRETQEAAINLYEESGYMRWGILPSYEFVNARMVAGHFFYKNLEPISTIL